MTRLVLDSGALSSLARRPLDAITVISVFKRDGLWPPVVPSVVLVESLSGRQRTDAQINRLLKTCDIAEGVPESFARRAALLRRLARRGSAVDAMVVAFAEPGGTVLTCDPDDLEALAAHADDVLIERM